MTVGHQTGGDTRSLLAHCSPVAVEGVEQHILFISIWHQEGTAVTERVEIPQSTVIIRTESVQPAKNLGLQNEPLRYVAEVLRPETRALVAWYPSGGQRTCLGGLNKSVQNAFSYKYPYLLDK